MNDIINELKRAHNYKHSLVPRKSEETGLWEVLNINNHEVTCRTFKTREQARKWIKQYRQKESYE